MARAPRAIFRCCVGPAPTRVLVLRALFSENRFPPRIKSHRRSLQVCSVSSSAKAKADDPVIAGRRDGHRSDLESHLYELLDARFRGHDSREIAEVGAHRIKSGADSFGITR